MKYFLSRNMLLALMGLGLAVVGCKEGMQAQKIVDEAIKKHGGEYFENVLISFDFRDRHYTLRKEKGKYEYTRWFTDSLGDYKDVLTNEGFHRLLNGEEVQLADTMAAKYTRSVNSVIYFATTPFVLNDPAVNKDYLGVVDVRGKKYHKVKITFDSQGGGEDHDDVFVYWFDEETYMMDYFAYIYHTDGGGGRFREIYNPRRVGNILFTDHINFKYDLQDTPITDFDQLYEDNQMIELSRIELENIEVKQL